MTAVRSSDLLPGPYVMVADVAEAMAFYATVFGAVELWRECLLDGRVLYAEVAVGRYRLALSEWYETPLGDEHGPPVPTYDCDDTEDVITRAVAAGAEVEAVSERPSPGVLVRDPFGQRWAVIDPT